MLVRMILDWEYWYDTGLNMSSQKQGIYFPKNFVPKTSWYRFKSCSGCGSLAKKIDTETSTGIKTRISDSLLSQIAFVFLYAPIKRRNWISKHVYNLIELERPSNTSSFPPGNICQEIQRRFNIWFGANNCQICNYWSSDYFLIHPTT